jgi:hypothetical protein
MLSPARLRAAFFNIINYIIARGDWSNLPALLPIMLKAKPRDRRRSLSFSITLVFSLWLHRFHFLGHVWYKQPELA